MKRSGLFAATVFIGSCVAGATLVAQQSGAHPVMLNAAPAQTLPKPGDKYDPSRDAALDIKLAVEEAKRTNRRVILDIGGEWCPWCHILDAYFVEHKDLAELRDKLYVWIKVNWSAENRNEAVIARYGKVPAYPHLFVLDREGKLVQSQGTSELEEGRSYNFDRMQQFLMRWAGGK